MPPRHMTTDVPVTELAWCPSYEGPVTANVLLSGYVHGDLGAEVSLIGRRPSGRFFDAAAGRGGDRGLQRSCTQMMELEGRSHGAPLLVEDLKTWRRPGLPGLWRGTLFCTEVLSCCHPPQNQRPLTPGSPGKGAVVLRMGFEAPRICNVIRYNAMFCNVICCDVM